MIMKAKFPELLEFLFEPWRYKVARGGRGSAKSWSFARALLIQGASKKLRILCAREVQLSIKQSVHKLLKDQIVLLGLEYQYQVYETEIRGSNGTEFAFTGLSSLTVDTIKSFEGYDICWVEEGQVISKRSWEILIPTIRKDESEIWISYNPDLETDETHQRFTINRPDNCKNVLINWRDNPFFNQVLDQERLRCKLYSPDDYDNIWEGECRPAAEGAIYYKQIAEAERQGRIGVVPYDPMLRVHIVYDLGWEDSLGAALVQVKSSEIRLIEYIEANHTPHDIYAAELRKRPYNWGKVWLPHDGFAGSLKSNGKSDADILTALGWDVARRDEIVEMTIEAGIRNVMMTFPRLYFDKGKCDAPAIDSPFREHDEDAFKTDGFSPTPLNNRLIEAVKRYRRQVNRLTEAVGSPVKDPNAHAADVLRYVCLNADQMTNERTGYTKKPVKTVAYAW